MKLKPIISYNRTFRHTWKTLTDLDYLGGHATLHTSRSSESVETVVTFSGQDWKLESEITVCLSGIQVKI